MTSEDDLDPQFPLGRAYITEELRGYDTDTEAHPVPYLVLPPATPPPAKEHEPPDMYPTQHITKTKKIRRKKKNNHNKLTSSPINHSDHNTHSNIATPSPTPYSSHDDSDPDRYTDDDNNYQHDDNDSTYQNDDDSCNEDTYYDNSSDGDHSNNSFCADNGCY